MGPQGCFETIPVQQIASFIILTRWGKRSLKYPGIFREAYARRDKQREAKVALGPGGELGGGHEEEPVEAAEGVEAGELEAAGGGGIMAEGEEGFKVVEVEAAQVPTNVFEPGAEDAALEGQGELDKTGAMEDAAAGLGAGEASQGGKSKGTKPIFFLGNDGGEAGKGGIDFGVEFLTDLREEMMAEPIAAVMGLQVGGVFAPENVTGLKPLAQAGTGDVQQGTEDGAVAVIEDAGETGGAGAAEQAEEDGFGLVFKGVSGEDDVDGTGGEPVVAEVAEGFLARAGGLDVVDEQFAAEGGGQLADVGFIGFAFGASQAIVDMQKGDGQVGLGAKAGECDRVATTADGDAETGVLPQAGEPGGGQKTHG